MKRLTYKIEATENGYTESLSFLGITVSKTWKRTDTGMRCEENDLCEQLEKAGIPGQLQRRRAIVGALHLVAFVFQIEFHTLYQGLFVIHH